MNPGRADPADDHRAHRHHRRDAPPRAEDRRSAARVPRVRARLGDRRAQRALRRQLPRRRAATRSATRGSRTDGSTRSRSRAGSSATRSRTSGSRRWPATSAPRSSRCTARTPTRPRPAEVLHALLERAAAFGVLGLDDLVALPTMRAHPSAAKLALTAKLPRRPGVYLFRDRAGRVLYVGKATNLRARVRSYFSTEDRRKVPQLLRETERIEHRVCRGPFEAAIRELRLIQRLAPRFNRASKSKRASYLKLTAERFPRLVVTPRRARRRLVVPRAVPVERGRAPRARGDRGRGAAPAVRHAHRAEGGDRARAAVCARAARRRDLPVPRADRRRRSTPRSPTSCGAGSPKIRRSCARRWKRACTGWPTASASRKRRPPATGSRRSRRRCSGSGRWTRYAPPARIVLEADEGRLVLAYGRVVLDESEARVDRRARSRRAARHAKRPTS